MFRLVECCSMATLPRFSRAEGNALRNGEGHSDRAKRTVKPLKEIDDKAFLRNRLAKWGRAAQPILEDLFRRQLECKKHEMGKPAGQEQGLPHKKNMVKDLYLTCRWTGLM